LRKGAERWKKNKKKSKRKPKKRVQEHVFCYKRTQHARLGGREQAGDGKLNTKEPGEKKIKGSHTSEMNWRWREHPEIRGGKGG